LVLTISSSLSYFALYDTFVGLFFFSGFQMPSGKIRIIKKIQSLTMQAGEEDILGK
jgi:hypothetical protein